MSWYLFKFLYFQSVRPKGGVFCYLITEVRETTALERPDHENSFVIRVCIMYTVGWCNGWVEAGQTLEWVIPTCQQEWDRVRIRIDIRIMLIFNFLASEGPQPQFSQGFFNPPVRHFYVYLKAPHSRSRTLLCPATLWFGENLMFEWRSALILKKIIRNIGGDFG